MAEQTMPIKTEAQQTEPATDQAQELAIDVPPVQFLHVADEFALEDAVRELKYATHIFLDCEGHQLGAVGGSMSLINVSCGPDGVVYVVDATCFEHDALAPLLDLLKNPEIKKVMFDGRMDASEFMHGYNIELEGVLDMQLADIASRWMRGEGPRDQLARLRPFIHPRDMMGHESDYLGVHRLSGLVKCMGEFNLPVVRRNEAYHERWQERPLPNAMLLAAARDVCYIRTLWEHFIAHGWIAQGELEAQSARYVALVRGMRPYHWDSYRCSGLLPQGILVDWRGGPNETQAPWTCELCQRELARCCFLQIAHYRPDRRFCATCRALRIRQMRAEERQHGDRSNIWQFLCRDEGRIMPPTAPKAMRDDKLGEHRVQQRVERRRRRDLNRPHNPERREPDQRRERYERPTAPPRSSRERDEDHSNRSPRETRYYRAKYRGHERERRKHHGYQAGQYRDQGYHEPPRTRAW